MNRGEEVAAAQLQEAAAEEWILTLAGTWSLRGDRPVDDRLMARLAAASGRLGFDSEQLTGWDSSLPLFLRQIEGQVDQRQLAIDRSGLPDGVRRLLTLTDSGSEAKRDADRQAPPGFLARVGAAMLQRMEWSALALAFLGGTTRAAWRMLRGKARWRPEDLAGFLQDCGPRALPIVSLIALLVGLILAFIGAMQLQTFGVQIYVANLVGIGMARDMGAMMTGIILAGRTGAAYAAQLGTMQVNEETDALRTLGIDPLEFLVLPRLLALVLMIPLLCCYADLMGIIGGGLVCVSLFDITPLQYLQQTREAVPLYHFTGGLVKATVYGIVVALAGCHRGLACGRSAAAVGEATTAAVVTSIVWIVVWCAILTVLYNLIGV
ncbi:ABC transporter permease [Desulfuromonas carbonis]|uniref:MlaE family ABC transporter permease n=1 Tax=Desulfuromonas sp. DDH964 TaxID=1823759 RepID=UPI00078B1C81|nr:ABC transporter permease [Desulfuromonas sp. DDH964]AMV70890.1 ABC transporter [Desulfuromonas sp. DDH964]